MNENIPYDKRYARQDHYWGKKPSAICDNIIQIIHPTQNFHPKLIDIGCGEGRNAIYLAKHGFKVLGLDVSKTGLDKTKKFAEEEGVNIETVQADINNYQLTETYDVIFSTGTLHYLSPNLREQTFRNYKEHTTPHGINAFSILVEKPFIPRAPDFDADASLFKSGEIMSYYWDWEILHSMEEIFDCMSSGVPHRHAVNRIIARRHHGNK